MKTSLTEKNPNEPNPVSIAESGSIHPSLDRTLTEIRSGRRLEKVAASIQSFLNSQVARLENAIDECNQSIENDKIVQRILAEFEVEKAEWEESRQAEILRLQAAGEQLIQGWEQLENERRQ